MKTIKAKYIKYITVIDPDTGGSVEVEIYKDPESGGIFGIDSSFVEEVNAEITSPFNNSTLLLLDE